MACKHEGRVALYQLPDSRLAVKCQECGVVAIEGEKFFQRLWVILKAVITEKERSLPGDAELLRVL